MTRIPLRITDVDGLWELVEGHLYLEHWYPSWAIHTKHDDSRSMIETSHHIPKVQIDGQATVASDFWWEISVSTFSFGETNQLPEKLGHLTFSSRLEAAKDLGLSTDQHPGIWAMSWWVGVFVTHNKCPTGLICVEIAFFKSSRCEWNSELFEQFDFGFSLF